MYAYLQTFMGEPVEMELTGSIMVYGVMVDLGPDIVVIRTKEYFLYIPLLHIHIANRSSSFESKETKGKEAPHKSMEESISYRKMIMHAKGLFVELAISANQSVHGYITAIMNDYVEFYSPVFHTLYLPLEHIKYMIPYPDNTTPYALNTDRYPVKPSGIPLSRTFEQQISKFIGSLVVLDLEHSFDKIGLLKASDDHMLEMVRADGTHLYLNVRHIKSIYVPDALGVKNG